MSRSNTSARMMDQEMKVIKRNGKVENISFDKILKRLKKIGRDNNIKINFTELAIRIIDQLYSMIPTTKIDELSAEQCASMVSLSSDFETMAVHIAVSNHHKNTLSSFSTVMEDLYAFRDSNGDHCPLLSQTFIEFVRAHAADLDAMCDFSRDYLFSYFGFKTLEKSYMMHIQGKILERPQHMWLRVAVALHMETHRQNDVLDLIRETYQLLSTLKYTQATPTLFNAGAPRQQLSSCFLLDLAEDSIEGIFSTLNDCAQISKWSGGIGVAISKVRAKGSLIRGTNGRSNGIAPMLRVFNMTSLYVDQCFPGDTIVYTTNRGPIEIRHCSAGDTLVVNLRGGTEKIANVLEHQYRGPMVTVSSPYFFRDLNVTPEHPICVFRKPATYAHVAWDDYLRDPHLEPIFVEAGQLDPCTDLVVFATERADKKIIRVYESDSDGDVPPTTNADKEKKTAGIWSCAPGTHDTPNVCDYYFYGLMAACNREHEGRLLAADLEFRSVVTYKMHEHVRKFIEYYLDAACVNYEKKKAAHTYPRWTAYIYEWENRLALPFRRYDFVDEAGRHRIHPRWLATDREDCLHALLRGLLDGQGAPSLDRELLMECPSRVLAESVRYLCLRLRIPTRGYSYFSSPAVAATATESETATPDNNGVTAIPPPQHTTGGLWVHVVKIPCTDLVCDIMDLDRSAHGIGGERPVGTYLYNDTYLLCPLRAVIKTADQISAVLYDLQMSKEHNYLTHYGVVHNGGGKRNGSFAIYLEPWHADVETFLELRKNHGDENLKARDLFYALWVCDLFMQRVKDNADWTLMCPNECPGLTEVYGQAFVDLYTRYEQEARGRKTIKARELWFKILDAQQETGTPYLVYKDASNERSNQKNIGIIHSSNLCSEVLLHTSAEETAVCNLASLSLPSCVRPGTAASAASYDFDELHRITKVVVRNLNRVIDVNYYPTEKTRRSNMRHRPIGLGTQGLYDVFQLLGVGFESPEATAINMNIFETIYHAAVESSCELAEELGPYETFEGCPASQGLLQFDLAGYNPGTERYDWPALKSRVQRSGLRNSVLLAQMPTASTSQILGNTESCEAITSNIFSRRTLAGEFMVVNKHLQRYLEEQKLWTEDLKNSIIAHDGSVQHLDCLTPELKKRFRTAWEISMRSVIDLAADRGKFICQSESLNLFVRDPNYSNLTSMHFHAWSRGLKTGQYYLRRRGVAAAQKFTIVPPVSSNVATASSIDDVANAGGPPACTMCSS